ncbi:MAG: glutathione S-transferase family protein [Betaproteobacteria bacterium]|nr:glutathione S-transferase family protein [Betaproteobacteria bacterium]
MLDLYTFQTSNGQRAAIMLEECALPFRVHRVDLTKGEQRQEAFLRLNPAGMIPVLVDSDGPGGAPLAIAQSGAILLYLAEKAGRLLPADPRARAEALQWLFFAVTDCAGASGAVYYHSAVVPEKSPANVQWYEERLIAHLRVADAQLAGRDALAGEYSVADVALFPIVALRRKLVERAGGMPNLARWLDAVGQRPAVVRGLAAGN